MFNSSLVSAIRACVCARMCGCMLVGYVRVCVCLCVCDCMLVGWFSFLYKRNFIFPNAQLWGHIKYTYYTFEQNITINKEHEIQQLVILKCMYIFIKNCRPEAKLIQVKCIDNFS